MDRRRVASTAVAVLAVSVALAGMAVWAGGDRAGGDWQWTLPVALVYGPAGVALVRRSPRLSALFLTMALSAAVSLLAGEQAEAIAEGRTETAGHVAVWLSSWTWLPSYVLLLAVVPHLLPDGRPMSGWWRRGWHLSVVAAGVATLSWMVAPYGELDEPSSAAVTLRASNPVGITGAGLLVEIGLLLVLVSAAVGVASLVVRWRREQDRRALAWVLGGVGLTVALMLASLLERGGSSALMALAVLPLPGAVLVGAAAHSASLDLRLRAAQAQLASAQEEERRRLRHDLHDSLGPALAAVALQLELLPDVVADDPRRAADVVERLAGRVQDAVAEVRRLVEGLGPDSSLGLAEALQAQVEVFNTSTLRSSLHVDADDVRHLPAAVEVVTVRVVREALANAARHARANACTVHVERVGTDLAVSVRDDGIGLAASLADADTRGTGVGLLSMRAVAGQIGGICSVLDVQGGGTEIRLVLPIPAQR